jgi:HCOMODA/2-hydroxy-3-carboxy-muconic semialdehyde decarboxylase
MPQANANGQRLERVADEVLFGARILFRELQDIFGHVSSRLPPEANREGLLFARMRVAPEPLDPDEVMELDFSCRRRSGNQHVSGETFIHAEIYKTRPEVGGVVHAHPFHVVTLSATGRQLQTFHPASIAFANVPLFGGQQINTEKDGRELAETLGAGSAIILKNHGAVTVGKDIAEAVVRMYYLERAAYAHLIAGSDLHPWKPDATYDNIIDQSYKFLWRTWRWEVENGGAMARWEHKSK